MASPALQAVLRHVHKLFAAPAAGEFTDRQLIERFAEAHDEAAFTDLFRRHGPLVLGVARRVLQQPQDAEDVLQATFLILARRAAAQRWHESLAGWLYRVAYRLALEAKAKSDRQRTLERRTTGRVAARAPARTDREEWFAVLDEELRRLPDRVS